MRPVEDESEGNGQMVLIRDVHDVVSKWRVCVAFQFLGKYVIRGGKGKDNILRSAFACEVV